MKLVDLSTLPDHSRLWIFAADRELSTEERSMVNQDVKSFLENWAAHGAPVEAGFEIRDNRFIFISASDSAAQPSGCSIDALTRFIRTLGEKLGANLMPSGRIFYRTNGNVEVADRPAFKQLASSGKVDSKTVLYDTTLTALGDVRAGKWEQLAGQTWHAATFLLA